MKTNIYKFTLGLMLSSLASPSQAAESRWFKYNNTPGHEKMTNEHAKTLIQNPELTKQYMAAPKEERGHIVEFAEQIKANPAMKAEDVSHKKYDYAKLIEDANLEHFEEVNDVKVEITPNDCKIVRIILEANLKLKNKTFDLGKTLEKEPKLFSDLTPDYYSKLYSALHNEEVTKDTLKYIIDAAELLGTKLTKKQINVAVYNGSSVYNKLKGGGLKDALMEARLQEMGMRPERTDVAFVRNHTNASESDLVLGIIRNRLKNLGVDSPSDFQLFIAFSKFDDSIEALDKELEDNNKLKTKNKDQYNFITSLMNIVYKETTTLLKQYGLTTTNALIEAAMSDLTTNRKTNAIQAIINKLNKDGKKDRASAIENSVKELTDKMQKFKEDNKSLIAKIKAKEEKKREKRNASLPSLRDDNEEQGQVAEEEDLGNQSGDDEAQLESSKEYNKSRVVRTTETSKKEEKKDDTASTD